MKYALFLGLLLTADLASAQAKRIVTYIEDVQEERRSTRWTLTEWLLIKERMKMMDLWLAMFSDPKKDRFAPELGLSYGRAGGLSNFDLGSTENFAADRVSHEKTHFGEEARVQFWFTNLVSSSTGLRTLDIDLGLEGRVVNRFLDQNINLDGGSGFLTDTDKLQQAGLNFRIFGNNAQDSSLVGKIGQFQRTTGFIEDDFKDADGVYYGGELSLYLLNWLGAEGNYYSYKGKGGIEASGASLDYFGFLELYNVRLGYGSYARDWKLQSDLLKLESEEQGRYFLLRLYL